MRRRRIANPFGMSFLDVMFCGFGSVVLLVMLVNANAITKREELHADLRGEVDRLEREVLTGKKYLVELRAAIEEYDEQRDSVRHASRDVRTDIGNSRDALEVVEEETTARTSSINQLQSDLKSLEVRAKGLQEELDEQERKGKQVRKFAGVGDRQYLTGLKMGGKRVLLLVDASASMLDETVVNVIRRRNLPDSRKRASRKWQRAIRTVEWLVSQLPVDSKFQLVTFNERAHPLPDSARAGWIDATDRVAVENAIDALRQVVPSEGTSLYSAFAVVRDLEPRPDNIYLLTDGLPTQGKSKPFRNTVTSKQRLGHFRTAVDQLPKGIPVNTILFPMEGDRQAALAFWQLTTASRGSMMSPSKDWP